MSRTIRISAGQIWVTRNPVTRSPSRRVIDVVGGMVCYSTGTSMTRWCQRRAFRIWIRRYHAVATRTRRPRTIVLRAAARA